MLINSNSDQFNAFLNIVDAIPVSVYWKDTFGRYLGCNKYMLDMAGPGLTRSDVIGKTDRDFVWKEIADELRQIDNLVIKNRAKYEAEETPVIANALKRTYLSTKSPLYDEVTGEIIGLIGVSVDITDRKNAENLQKEKEVNDKISQALEILSGSIAHEVRTPLAGIGVNVDALKAELSSLLKDNVKEEQKMKVMYRIKNIKFGVNRANNIVSMLLIKLRSILGYQTEKKSYTRELKPVYIKNDINEALKEYPFSESERKILIWGGNNNEDFKYVGSPIFTKHILFNLIKNSLEAIRNVERGKIQISLKPGKKFNRLIFEDTATGIPAKDIGNLFQHFRSSSKDGSGLGLVFCKITMQSYGGDITCESEEGKYTKFILSFPAIN